MRFAAIQMHANDNRDENVERAARLLDEAAAVGADVAVLPELFSVPFVGSEPDPEYFRWAEPLEGPSHRMVSARSREHRMAIVSSIFEEADVPGVYHNTAVTYAEGTPVSVYRKSHLPFSNSFPEKFYFRPGERPPEVVKVGDLAVGTIICYERHFIELGRLTALGGAHALCIPVACASEPTREVFVLELRAHAAFNSLYVICANRVGREGTKTYYGSSLVCAPDGTILAEACGSGDEVVVADAELSAVASRRRVLPFFRDRRPHLYAGLTAATTTDDSL